MIKKFSAILLSVIFCCGTVAFAAPKLGITEPEENFEYSDEIIGRALQSSVAKIHHGYTATIEYTPLELDFTGLIKYLTRVEDSNPNATQEQISDFVYKKVAEGSYLKYGTPKECEVTIGWSGSGVALSDDGYIATNEHVIYAGEQERQEAYISNGISEAENDYNSLISQLAATFGKEYITDEAEDFWKQFVASVYMKNLKIKGEKGPYIHVIFPDADGNTDMSSAISYEAEIVKEGKCDSDNGNTEDAAILKINTSDIISLKLSEEYPQVNAKIFAAGFPGASTELFATSGNTSDMLAVTITNGNVSRLVPIDNSKYELIQTTATINHGNSGGPSVDTNMEILGLNTLGVNTTDSFWMVSAEMLRDLSDDVPIGQGEASRLFMSGLQALQQGYGKTAVDAFTQVRDMQPNTPYINVLISDAQEAPQKAMIGGFKINPKLIIALGAGLALLIAILIIVSNVKKKRRRKAITQTNDIFGSDDDIAGNDFMNNDVNIGGSAYDFDSGKDNNISGSDWL